MAITTRQTSLLVAEDWTRLYQTFRNANFQSYDYETLRATMVSYLQLYYPEDFNDFIESSEFIALIDMIAFLGQSLAFRADLNARENYIDTAKHLVEDKHQYEEGTQMYNLAKKKLEEIYGCNHYC